MVESWLVVEPHVNKIKKDITVVHHQFTPAKEFLRCFVCCGEAVEIGKTEFASSTIFKSSLEFGIKNCRPIKIEESFD